MFASSSKSTKVHPTSLLCVSAHAGCVINPGDKIKVPMPGFFKVHKLTCVINGAPFGWSVQVDTNPDIDPGVAPEKMARSYHEYNDTGKIIKIIEQTLSKLESLIPHRIPSGIIPSGMNTLLDFLDDAELVMFTEILRRQIMKHCDIEIERLEPGNIQDPDKKLNLQIFQPGNNMLMRIYDLEDLGAAFGSLIRFHEDVIVLDKPSVHATRTNKISIERTNQEIFGSIPAERILFCDFGCWGVDMYLDPREQRRNNLDIIKYLEKEVDTRTQTILKSVIDENAKKFSHWQAKLEYSGEAALEHSGEAMEEYSGEEDDDISLGGNRKTRKQRKNKRNKTNRRNNKKNNKTNNKTNKRNRNKRRRSRK